jgi:hypothetical protein
MPKFFLQPFATAGDKTAIPEPVQVSGSVSYNQGWGPDYSREQGVDPLAKDVPREQTNQVYFDITDNLAFWQRNGAPLWVTAAENGGSPLAYSRGAIVRYRANPGDPYRTYVNQVDANTNTPGSAGWIEFYYIFPIASDTTSVGIPVDPAYVTARLAGVSITVPAASTTVAGISQYATSGETITGTIANRTVTVTGLAATAANFEWATPNATTVASGRVRLTTNGEAAAFSLTTLAVTPAALGAAIPPATTADVGRTRYATLAETTAHSAVNAAVTPPGLAGHARLNTNVSFTLVQSSGGFDVTSSRHVKQDLRPNNYGLLSVLAIETAVGRYRRDYVDDPRAHVFLIAEQLAEVVPLAVRDGGATYNGQPVPTVNYDMLVPVLVKALQEEHAERVKATRWLRIGIVAVGALSAFAAVLAAFGV